MKNITYYVHGTARTLAFLKKLLTELGKSHSEFKGRGHFLLHTVNFKPSP